MRSFRHVFGMIKLSDADRARTRPPRGRSRRCNGDGPRSEVKAAGLLLAPLVVLLTLRMAVSGAVLRCADRREPRGAAGAVSDPGTTPYGGHAGPVVSVAYAPDGATLATVGSDGAWIWDARTAGNSSISPATTAGCSRWPTRRLGLGQISASSTGAAGLITQRSQVQILPPLPS